MAMNSNSLEIIRFHKRETRNRRKCQSVEFLAPQGYQSRRLSRLYGKLNNGSLNSIPGIGLIFHTTGLFHHESVTFSRLIIDRFDRSNGAGGGTLR